MAIDWSKIHLLIGTPTKGSGSITPEYVEGYLDIEKALTRRGARVSGCYSCAPTMHMARGQTMWLAAQGKGDVTHFLALDDDLKLRGETVVRMLETEHPVIGAAYRIKHPDRSTQFVVIFSGPQVHQEVAADGTIEVQRLGGGCILYSIDAILALLGAYGHFTWAKNTGLACSVEFVDEKTREFVTEDYATCDRWRAIGGTVRLLLDAETVHVGGAGKYPGNFRDLWPLRHRLMTDTLGEYNAICLDKSAVQVNLQPTVEREATAPS